MRTGIYQYYEGSIPSASLSNKRHLYFEPRKMRLRQDACKND